MKSILFFIVFSCLLNQIVNDLAIPIELPDYPDFPILHTIITDPSNSQHLLTFIGNKAFTVNRDNKQPTDIPIGPLDSYITNLSASITRLNNGKQALICGLPQIVIFDDSFNIFAEKTDMDYNTYDPCSFEEYQPNQLIFSFANLATNKYDLITLEYVEAPTPAINVRQTVSSITAKRKIISRYLASKNVFVVIYHTFVELMGMMYNIDMTIVDSGSNLSTGYDYMQDYNLMIENGIVVLFSSMTTDLIAQPLNCGSKITLGTSTIIFQSPSSYFVSIIYTKINADLFILVGRTEDFNLFIQLFNYSLFEKCPIIQYLITDVTGTTVSFLTPEFLMISASAFSNYMIYLTFPICVKKDYFIPINQPINLREMLKNDGQSIKITQARNTPENPAISEGNIFDMTIDLIFTEYMVFTYKYIIIEVFNTGEAATTTEFQKESEECDLTFTICYELCKTCTNIGNIIDHQCTECKDGYALDTINTGMCLPACDPDQFFYYDNITADLICGDSLGCPNDYSYNILDTLECLSICPVDNYYQDEPPKMCYPIECPTTKSYYITGEKKCMTKCPLDYPFFIKDKTECYNTCPLNKPNTIVGSNECIDLCPLDYPYLLIDSFQCVEKCNLFIFQLSPSDNKECRTACPDKYYLNASLKECVTDCPIGYDFIIQLTNECVMKCPLNYGIIPNTNQCQECLSPMILNHIPLQCMTRPDFENDINNRIDNLLDNNIVKLYQYYPKWHREFSTFIAYHSNLNEFSKSKNFNLTTIDFEPCEQILKASNILPSDQDLLIAKIDRKINNQIQVDYFVFSNDETPIDISGRCTLDIKCPGFYPNFQSPNICLKCNNGFTSLNQDGCVSEEEFNSELEDIMNNIEDNILYLEEYYSNLSVNNSTFEIYNTTSSQEDNGSSGKRNISKIDLGKCEDKLRETYNIPLDEPLLIFKKDTAEGKLVNKVEYAVFTIDGKKLDLKPCDDTPIEISVPINTSSPQYENALNLTKQGINPYDPEQPFYSDVCVPFESNDGLDIPRSDRINEFYQDQSEICPEGCVFKGINETTGSSICSCTKPKPETEGNSFDSIKSTLLTSLTSGNWGVALCYFLVFDGVRLINNYGSWFQLVIAAIIITTIAVFSCTKLKVFESHLHQLSSKDKQDHKEIDRKESRQSGLSEQAIAIANAQENDPKDNKATENKNIKEGDNLVQIQIMNQHSKPLKKQSTQIITNENSPTNKLNHLTIQNNHELKQQTPEVIINLNTTGRFLNKENYTIESYNRMTLEDLIANDKRNFIKHYWNYLQILHPILDTFFIPSRIILRAIKICNFFLSLMLDFTLSAFFYTDTYISNNYQNNGFSDFWYNIPISLYSYIVGTVLNVLFGLLSNPESVLSVIENDESQETKIVKINSFMKSYRIRLSIFFILQIVFLCICWYFTSAFCATYSNSQDEWLKSGLISTAMGLAFPFGFAMIATIVLEICLRCKCSCMYKLLKLVV